MERKRELQNSDDFKGIKIETWNVSRIRYPTVQNHIKNSWIHLPVFSTHCSIIMYMKIIQAQKIQFKSAFASQVPANICFLFPLTPMTCVTLRLPEGRNLHQDLQKWYLLTKFFYIFIVCRNNTHWNPLNCILWWPELRKFLIFIGKENFNFRVRQNFSRYSEWI